MDLKLRCPRCKSSQTRYRVKTKDRICYQCGTIYDPEQIERENQEDSE